MSELERRIEGFERRLNERACIPHIIFVPGVFTKDDEDSKAKGRRQALEKNPTQHDIDLVIFVTFIH